MSDAVQPHIPPSAREDIAFMRALAEEGASGPILGGSILLATGLIYAVANAAFWVVVTRAPHDTYRLWPWIWGVALTAQVLTIALVGFRLRKRGTGVMTRSNRVFAGTWNGVGLAILACLLSFLLDAKFGHVWAVFEGSPAVILALYGVGWTATAASSNERWAWAVAGLSFLFAIAAGAFARNANLLLLFALALLLLLAAPGALLIKRAQARG